MREMIEKNRHLRCQLCGVGRILGWLQIALFIFGAGCIGWYWTTLWDRIINMTSSLLLSGVAMLMVAQFILLVIDKKHRPGWMLKKGPLIMYLFACCLLAKAVFSVIEMGNELANLDLHFRLIALSAGMIPFIVKILILLSMGIALKLSLPIIAESKTLV